MASRMLGSVAVVALVMAVAVPVAATANTTTNKLQGAIDGDANGKVSMKIVVKDGEPVKAIAVKVSNLDYKCQSGDMGERTFNIAKIAIKPDYRAVGPTLPYVFGKKVRRGDVTYTIEGETTKKGNQVEGEALVTIDSPGNACTSANLPGDPDPNGRYTVKK